MNLSSTVNVPATRPETASYQLLSAGGRIKLDRKIVQVSGVRGTTGRGVKFTISNVGTGQLRFGTDAFTFTGIDAADFAIVGGSLPRVVSPGKRATFTVALKPRSKANVSRVLTATLSIKQSGAASAAATLAVRGIATTGEGADKEPSLARILELFQYDVNVGDTTPNTTFLDLDGSPTDQIAAPRFHKIGNGVVTITPLAQFVNRSTTIGSRHGIYSPGTPDSRRQLFDLSGPDSQSVNLIANGSNVFDPGTGEFSLWAEAPAFTDDNHSRIIYGEEALNTWEPDAAKRNKVRVYPLKQNGQVIANAYVVAFEEYSLQNDQNDAVYVISGVAPLTNQPEVGLIALDGQPDPDRLAFNRIETPNADLGNRVYDVAKVRVVNTGTQDLILSNVRLVNSGGYFQLVNPPSASVTLHRNATIDLSVRFIAHAGDVHHAILSFDTSDVDEPNKQISLSGFWQSDSENDSHGVSQEPNLEELFKLFGFRTEAVFAGQNIKNRGKTEAVGDEMLANLWAAADPGKPVFVHELAGFHEQGQSDEIAWYPTGQPYYRSGDPRLTNQTVNGQRNALFDTHADDGQTLFPRKFNSNAFAAASFRPGTGTFGLRVNAEYSEDSLNIKLSGDLGGHHFRFYPARDENNNFLPDTYLVTVDFASINFDYNDDLLLVQNIRPANRPAAINGLSAIVASDGNHFSWSSVPGAAGYAVLRADKSGGPYQRLNADLLTATNCIDTGAPGRRTRYYRVVAVDADGEFGLPANLGVTRP